jgi:hypothetical protein
MARRNLGAAATLAAWMLGLGTACSAGPGPDKGPLCPSCTAWVGGETGDFESDVDDCARWFIKTTQVSEQQARELGVDPDELRARIEVDFTAPFRWALSADPGSPALPKGYSKHTTIVGSTRIVGTLSRRRLDPERCEQGVCTDPEVRADSFECPPARYDGLTFDLDLDLTLADGALAVTKGRARAWVGFSDWADDGPSAAAQLWMDLTQVEGTLRLEPEQEGPAMGELRGRVEFYGGGEVSGSLEPVVHAPTSSMDVFDPDYWEYRPLVGVWPNNDG